LAEQVSSTTEKFSDPNNSEEENIVNLTEKLKLSKFIEALRPDIRVEVKKLGPKTFKSAVEIAKNIDNALSDDGAELNVTDSGINQILSQQLSTNKEILELSEKVNAISSQNLCVNSLTEAPATNSNNVQSYQQSPCQICGKLNHKANNCFHYTRGNYYRGNNSRASYNRTFRANNFHPYRSRANQRSNYGRGFRVGNQKFDFEENSPTNVCSETTDCDISENDKNKKESFEQINYNFGDKVNVSEETFHAHNVKIANNITVQPFSTQIINLKVPKNISKNKDLIFIPKKNKLGYLINESLNVPTNANLFHTIIENNTNKVIHVRKNTIMGKLSTFDVNDIMSPSESEIYQINNLNLNEIHKMRRNELLKSDFKLDHLNDKDKKDMQDLLLKNYKVFSKSYKTLGETSAVIPEFSLLHNFPLQTKPYSIPLMAKKYAQQEINNLLEAGIIEPSSSCYCFPVIFTKKKHNPNDSNSEPKFRMVVDYRLLNSITETFKICLPKISEIIKNIAGRKIYCVLDLKSAFFQIKLRDEDKRKLAFCTEIEFFSRKLTSAECKYPSIRRELLAIYASVKHFHDQLLGENFELLTDAKPLTEYQSLDKKPEIVARWLLYLGTFSFTPTHIPGILNPADFLSRVVEENSLNVNNITLFQPNDKLSMQNILIEQKQDAILSNIMNDLSVDKQFKQYFLYVNSGLLMIKNAHKNKKKIVNRIVIPKSLIKVCIETSHAPHFGVKKTFEFIRHKYQWKGMYLDTKKICEHCEKCLENKPKAKLTQTQMIPKRNLAPGQCIAIDIVGKLPRSTDNKNFILTIIDHYSRYLEAYPLQNITSRTIINCLNKYFANFGLPKFLITDNASNFISNEMVEFLDRLNIQHRKSSIYYPMANGLLERAHRTMKESLASMCESTFQW
ncbi:Uncharacterized protein K02A2.6, partial [Araneus ventricosus]